MINSKKASFPLSSFLWGNSIGLSWMWGLGLFFSVQFTIQYGLMGLLCFSIPNAVGLFLFGYITDKVANRHQDPESLAIFFNAWSKPFRLPLFLYQVAALSLTIFAIIRYLWQPLDLDPAFIYLPLGLLIVLAAAFLFGEEFGIQRIKWSHSAMWLLAMIAILILCITNQPNFITPKRPFTGGELQWGAFLGYLVPICVGLLVGPWMDLQQWQRAIQIRREGQSIVSAYAYGAVLFFGLLIFHGGLTNWALTEGAATYVRSGLLDFKYGHEVLTEFFHSKIKENPLIFGAYATFVCVCILTTLDSGYIALRWLFTTYLSQSKGFLFSLLPVKLMTSPIPVFLVAAMFAVIALFFNLELEYFMILYATFFVAYSALGMLRVIRGKSDLPLPQVKMFCVGVLSMVIFSFGYLREIPFFLVCGSLIPVGYILWLLVKSQTHSETHEVLVDRVVEKSLTSEMQTGDVGAFPSGSQLALADHPSEVVDSSEGYFEGKTFVHSLLSTYGDTNSVGNIYFGMYAMWVGKTRELFLRKVMPDFDIETTEFYILTRSFEHKFVREAKEFEKIRIEISLGDHNRKFIELNHRVLDGTNKVLGKGKQTLMFVASKDYSLLDIPASMKAAFVPYATTLEPKLR
jgi:acyl-CoA thioesterase FadM